MKATASLMIATVCLSVWLTGCSSMDAYYKASESRNARTQKQLSRTVDLSKLEEDTTFEEAMELFRNSVDPPLKMVVLWKEISENAFIEKNTAVGFSGEGLSSVPLRTGLKIVIEAIGGGGGLAQLGYVVYDGVVLVASKDHLFSYMEPSEEEGDAFNVLGSSDEPWK